jgi:hypothetical protein
MSEQTRAERRARSAEIALKDREFNELLDRDRILIPSSECMANNLYMGEGRQVGRLAICVGSNSLGSTEFIGLGGNPESIQLIAECHKDSDRNFGSWKPHLLLGQAPLSLSEIDLKK